MVTETACAISPIVLVDDEEDGIIVTTALLRRSGIAMPIRAMPSAEDLVTLLQRCHANGDAILSLIIMDLHMPRLSGFEALKWMRSQEWLSGLFVAIISSSTDERDVQTAARLGASAYIERYPSPAALRSLYEFTCCSEHMTPLPMARPFFHLRATGLDGRSAHSV